MNLPFIENRMTLWKSAGVLAQVHKDLLADTAEKKVHNLVIAG